MLRSRAGTFKTRICVRLIEREMDARSQFEKSNATKGDTPWLGRPPRSSRSASASRSTAICRPNSDFHCYSFPTKSPVKSRALTLVRQPMRSTTTAVTLTLVVVAAILIAVLLWPLGRLPWPDFDKRKSPTTVGGIIRPCGRSIPLSTKGGYLGLRVPGYGR